MNPEQLLLLRSELQRDEGIRYEAYQDSVGLWTIGWGHLLGIEERMLEVTHAEAESLLYGDIKYAEQVVQNLFPKFSAWPRSFELAVRYRALVNMAFNLGQVKLAGFKKFIAAVEAADWSRAATEMMDSKWATQVGARATRLRDMIR